MEEEIKEFIKRFSQFGLNVKKCFSEKNCYYFYIILKSKYSEAIPYYDKKNSHVVTKIDNNFYDINGKLSQKRINNLNLIPFCDINSGLKNQLL